MREIWKFIFMLTLSLALLTIYSFEKKALVISFPKFQKDSLILDRIELKQTAIHELFIPDTILPIGKTPISIRKATKTTDTQAELDTTSQRILLIGDSMLEGLRLRLRDYCQENGHDQKTVIWYSSQSKWYGQTYTLSHFIKQYKPTYVLLVLGANELFVPQIKTKRSRYVKHIVAQLDTIPYVWIGPPNWKEDTGINELIVEHVGQMRYYPSKDLTFARTSDGAHPTHRSAAMWMDSVATWIMRESKNPILLNQPTKKHKGSTNTTLLQPL